MLKLGQEDKGIKVLFKNEWISIKDKNGYFFSHEERCNGMGVAVLGWKTNNNKLEILGRFEQCPAHNDNIELCSLTGGIDNFNPDKDKIHVVALSQATKELEEESGISVPSSRLRYIGAVRPSKSADSIIFLYSVFLPKENPISKPNGDGSELEKTAFCKWISLEEAISSKDPILHSMITKIQNTEENLKSEQ